MRPRRTRSIGHQRHRLGVASNSDRAVTTADAWDHTAVLGRVQVLRSAPPLRAPSATWTRPPRGGVTAFIVGGPELASIGLGERAVAIT